MSLNRAALIVLALGLAASSPILAQAPNADARVDAFFEALSSGSAVRFEAMAQENFSPEALKRRSVDDRKQMVERVHADFGALTRVGERVREGGTFELTVRGKRGEVARIALTLEPVPPHRIERMGIERGGPAEEPTAPPPPEVQGTMTPEALSRGLDGYLQGLAAVDEFAGVVLVAKDGKTLFERGYGLASREDKTPITPELRFSVASIGKAFTKVAIGQLLAQGQLALADTIGTLLPDYPNPEARGATVAQLLDHTAGIADFFGPAFEAAAKDKFRSNADYYRWVAPQPLLFAPGSRNQYCNGCYIVLGAIVERLAGKPYEAYVAENVFARAGMSGAGFLASDGSEPRTAPGYTRGEPQGALRSNRAMHGLRGSAAGGSYARAADLLAFDNALREQRLLDSQRTAWFLGGATATGRVVGPYGIAGGSAGINAALESDGVWTVAVVGNLDPPNAGRVGSALMKQLTR
jgi:D-alanyl-D-alanine carboxypeptidase